MIRSTRPIELFALASFTALAGPNEAQCRNNLGREQSRPLSVSDLLKKGFSLGENRRSWVSVDGGRIQGLVSARNRSGPSAWDVDCLLVAPRTSADELCPDLLEYLCRVGGETGVERVFLRLSHQSSIHDAARRVGFNPLFQETLYLLKPEQRERQDQLKLTYPLRPKAASDDQGLFQLYNASVPCGIRQMEALTLREWKETREHPASNGRHREYVYEQNQEILGWVQISFNGDRAFLDLLCHPQEEHIMASLLKFGLSHSPGHWPVSCLTPDFQVGWQKLAEEQGFEMQGQYYMLIRQLTARVKQPKLVPLRV